MRTHFNDREFIIQHCGSIGFKNIAFIERVYFEFNNVIRLIPKYIFQDCNDDSFEGFDLMGEVIDDFFCPSSYFYERSLAGDELNANLIYGNEIADNWLISFEGTSVTIKLIYDYILHRGIASDLMLHPKLSVQFIKTLYTQYIYRLFSMIIRFLQIIRYDVKCGSLQIELFNIKNEDTYHNGYLLSYCKCESNYIKGYHNLDYGIYKPYIQKFLQFAADTPYYSFHHYPEIGTRFYGKNHTPVEYMSIFSSFEGECHTNKEIYECVDASRVRIIRKSLPKLVDEYPRKVLIKEEQQFLNEAKNNISKIGTQFGQKMKIMNAYSVLRNALNSYIEHIFFLPGLRLKGSLKETDLNVIANAILDRVLHHAHVIQITRKSY